MEGLAQDYDLPLLKKDQGKLIVYAVQCVCTNGWRY